MVRCKGRPGLGSFRKVVGFSGSRRRLMRPFVCYFAVVNQYCGYLSLFFPDAYLGLAIRTRAAATRRFSGMATLPYIRCRLRKALSGLTVMAVLASAGLDANWLIGHLAIEEVCLDEPLLLQDCGCGIPEQGWKVSLLSSDRM